jgi:hypothetical protein
MALTTILPSGLNSANDFSSLVPSAYDKANSGASFANGAFLTANAAFTAANIGKTFVQSGGTINGSVVISQDLNVSGNITFGGNSTSISSNNLTLTDSLLYLADGNSGNTIDIGIVGNFDDGVYQHTAVFRDHLDGRWKFVSNVVSEPTTTISLTGARYDVIKSGGIELTDSVVFADNTLQNTAAAPYAYTNAAFAHANAAFSAANTGGGGGGGGASVTVGGTAPSPAANGYLWYDDTTTGELFVYSSGAWVTTSIMPSTSADAPSITGPTQANEATTQTFTISNYNGAYTYIIAVTGGSVTRTNQNIYWTMPSVTTNTTYYMTTQVVNAGTTTAVDTRTVLVVNLNVSDTSVIITDFTVNSLSAGWY